MTTRKFMAVSLMIQVLVFCAMVLFAPKDAWIKSGAVVFIYCISTITLEILEFLEKNK